MSATIEDLEKDLELFSRGRINMYRFQIKYLKPENISALFDFTYRYKLPITFDYSKLRQVFEINGKYVSAVHFPVAFSMNYLYLLETVVDKCKDNGIDYHDFLKKEELDLHYLYNILKYDTEIDSTDVNIVIYINLFIIDNKLVDTRNYIKLAINNYNDNDNDNDDNIYDGEELN